MNQQYSSKEEIHNKALDLIGIPFGSIDGGRLSTGKGGIGTMVEEDWFGLAPNSSPLADFQQAGVELKVTPYQKNKNGSYSAKERLVLGLIDYLEEYKQSFATSSLLEKNSTLEILFYQHVESLPRQQWTVDYAILFEFPEQDLKIIKDDWETIMSYIKAGKAHLLSEGMTDYLGACTKGASARSLREQPFSSIPARQRAFSLKKTYMTHLLRTYVMGETTSESVVQQPFVLGETLEDYITRKVSPFLGKSQWQIAQAFPEYFADKSLYGKGISNFLLSAMLGIEGKAQNTQEFRKAGIVPKTITLDPTGFPRQAMSFAGFQAVELVSQPWEDSSLRDLFESNRFLFVVFEETQPITGRRSRQKLEHTVLKKIQFWSMPTTDIEGGLFQDWRQVRQVFRAGFREERRGSRYFNNLPEQGETKICHVRPHARKRAVSAQDSNADLLPTGGFMTRQSFWLNRQYLLSQIEDTPYQFRLL